MSEQCASLLSAINQFDKVPQIDADVSKVFIASLNFLKLILRL